MPLLHIHLLGEFRLTCDEEPVSTFNAPRLQALLAYLLLHRDAPQLRHHLAFLLWPDTTEAQARTNLRQLLHGLKQTLPEADHFLSTSAKTVQWRPNAPFRLDVAEFEQACALAEAAAQQGDLHAQRGALEQAVAFYHGDLLPSCYDDWILPERERLRQALTEALERLLLLLESQGQPRAALAFGQRLLRHDPLREDTYRALMRLYAACGDRAGVLRVYHTCTSVLERELGVEPSTATRDAYERALSVEVQAPPMPPQPAHTNLPVQLTSFIGRARELAELKRLLGSTHLLTLTGPGGIGKTRLALQLAAEVLEPFAAGAWLVELASLGDPALVTPTLAATLGVHEQPGRPLLDALLDYVRAKSLLLLLDNCEHLIEPCAPLVESLLRAAPGLRIVASSREALGLTGETVYRVPSLALPDPRHLRDLDALAHNESVYLLVDRAQAAYPSFRLTARNAPAIVQICRRLDGIPLALELAAARTRVFPPEQIAARLSDRFRLLTGGSRTALPRHQTLLALIDWSYELLSEGERVLLRRLSVFAGGWSWEAAQAVCGDGLGDEVLDSLVSLVDKSLIVVEEPMEAAEGRYRLLETIRQYAREKLLASGEAEAVRDRHLEYFLRLAEEAEPRLRRAEQLGWLNRLETEHENLRTALAWSLERGKSDRVLRLAGALSYFWELRGYWSEGCKWLDEALARASHEQRGKGSASEPSPLTPPEQAQRAKALYGSGRLRFMSLLDPDVSRAMVEESLRMWCELGDKWWMAVALEHVGFMSGVEGDVQMARTRLEEGVALAREVEDRWPLALCLVRLAARMDVALARQMFEEGVALARTVGDKSILSQGLDGMGGVYFLEGKLTEAARVCEEGLAEARAIGDFVHLMLSLLLLAVVTCLQGDTVKAKEYGFQVLTLARETGASQWLLLVILVFGFVAIFNGQPGRGLRLFTATQTLLRQRGLKLDILAGPLPMIVTQALEKAQAQLDPASFQAALQEGRGLTLEQALALATENASQDSQRPEAGPGPSFE
jgi:predicted ATPase/DNA-binding SARP family transcriptional activator